MVMNDSIITQPNVKTELAERLKTLRAERNPYGNKFSKKLKAEIRFRDRYLCRRCKKSEKELGQELDVHHIFYDKKDQRPEGLISLCRPCHIRTNANRWYWQRKFEKENKRYYKEDT